MSVLVTTAPTTKSADLLFSQHKQQNYVELLPPDEVARRSAPPFPKTPRRVEALVCLLQVALQAYQVLERPSSAKSPARRNPGRKATHQRKHAGLGVYGLIVERTNLGRAIHTT